MIRVGIDRLQPGMTIARKVCNSDGQILAAAGAVVTPDYVQFLKKLGIASIYVNDSWPDLNEIKTGLPNVISDETRLETMRCVRDSFHDVTQFRRIDTSMVQQTVSQLLEEIIATEIILVNLADIRAFDDYVFAHSVNVGLLAILMGINQGYSNEKLQHLGAGALLHDLGKIFIPEDILNKPDDLDPEEFEEVKKHCRDGYEILREYEELSESASIIALQHHERSDGQGYPGQLKHGDIHEFARIVAVADVYDALLADRPYRAAYSLNQAIAIIQRMSGSQLDPVCVDSLLANVSVYPPGSLVELNTGSIAMVLSSNKDQPDRPVVKVLYDKSRQKLDKPHRVDLTPYPSVMIKRCLNEEECQLYMSGR